LGQWPAFPRSGSKRRWVSEHRGTRDDFLQRHRKQVRRALKKGWAGIAAIAGDLLYRVSDERTLRIAWDYLAEYGGQAPGPDGARYSDRSDSEAWAMCRSIRDVIRANEYQPSEETVKWVPKGPGRNRRPLVIQCIHDRVVQRAVVEIVQPVLNPRFCPGSFGYRPGKRVEQALAHAEFLLGQGRTIWLCVDLQDAFSRVPLPRLLDVVKKYLRAPDLTDFIRCVLGWTKVPGLRQGGPLSPLLLNLYLHHFLDRRWRAQSRRCALIRYADDILVLCPSVAHAEQAYDELLRLLQPTGMTMKENRDTALRTLAVDRPAEWMGFRITKAGENLQVELTQNRWHSLNQSLIFAHEKADSPVRACESIRGWVAQLGPCYPCVNRLRAYDRIAALAQSQGFDEIPDRGVIEAVWQRAYARWCKLRKTGFQWRSLILDDEPQ
jgi:hypothetical protein